ncbi:glycosyltransferase family 2 protein [Psychromicrobium xiongbiense]|uniref:glycosyltransferase family 2 protein n=1 Tax=Psychromicrobium xiongbiense TaxID=3051184 RepID=UPI0025555C8F|nr:glycosyltransferase family 2 protein [Psychromicrobium sp. YIM S02556]
MIQIDIIFPCLNEARALPTVLARLPEGARAIVVDNGCEDGSAAIARSLGALVIQEARRGFGSAAHAGLLAATAPLVAFCDADGSLDPSDLESFRTLIAAGEADLVLGARQASAGAWPPHARWANAALAWRLRRITGAPLSDLGPLRLARREPLLELGLTDRRSGYPLEMVLRAHHAGWRLAEFPVDYRPRIGRSKITGTVRGTLTAVADMHRVLGALA